MKINAFLFKFHWNIPKDPINNEPPLAQKMDWWKVIIWANDGLVCWYITTRHQNGIWWRHQMETFSAVLAICARNSLVTGEFPTQRPVTRSFNVFFDLRLNKRFSKQYEAGNLKHHHAHYDVTEMVYDVKIFCSTWDHVTAIRELCYTKCQ